MLTTAGITLVAVALTWLCRSWALAARTRCAPASPHAGAAKLPTSHHEVKVLNIPLLLTRCNSLKIISLGFMRKAVVSVSWGASPRTHKSTWSMWLRCRRPTSHGLIVHSLDKMLPSTVPSVNTVSMTVVGRIYPCACNCSLAHDHGPLRRERGDSIDLCSPCADLLVERWNDQQG